MLHSTGGPQVCLILFGRMTKGAVFKKAWVGTKCVIYEFILDSLNYDCKIIYTITRLCLFKNPVDNFSDKSSPNILWRFGLIGNTFTWKLHFATFGASFVKIGYFLIHDLYR